MHVYRIKNWAEHYENNRTRDLQKMSWVPMPNGHDGDGFCTLMDHPDGLSHFGAWVILLQVASKCGPRGTLLRSDRTPHTAATIARIGRTTAVAMQAAIDRLIAEVGWLEVIDMEDDGTKPHPPAVQPHSSAGLPQADASSRACAERNGTERKGSEIAAALVIQQPRAPEPSPPPLPEPDPETLSAIADELWAAMDRRGSPPHADRSLLLQVHAAIQGATVDELHDELASFRRGRRPPNSHGFWPIYLADKFAPAVRARLAEARASPVERSRELDPEAQRWLTEAGWLERHQAVAG